MIAERDRARAQRIARGRHLAPFGQGFLVRALEPADGKVDPLARHLPVRRRIAFGQHQFARQAQQRIGKAGRGRIGIILQAYQRPEVDASRAFDFQGIEPEADPPVGEHMAYVGAGRRAPDRTHFAVVDRAQQLKHFRTGAARAFVIAQEPGAVRAQRCGQRGCRRAQRPQIRRIGFDGAFPAALEHS